MAGGTYAISASLGDLSGHPLSNGTLFKIYPGFWSSFSGTIVDPAGCLLDIDGNGRLDALTDGLLILRTMFGLTGTSVTNGAVGTGAQFTAWADIQPRIHIAALDIDGNGTTDALTDGLLILRAMFGLTGTTVTDGVTASGAPRATWAAVRGYLNASCGGSFGP